MYLRDEPLNFTGEPLIPNLLVDESILKSSVDSSGSLVVLRAGDSIVLLFMMHLKHYYITSINLVAKYADAEIELLREVGSALIIVNVRHDHHHVGNTWRIARETR
jgi:hypothetical protein